MIDLQSYLAEEILHEGLKTIVYRGVRKKDGLPVILKALRHEYPLPEDAARLRREFEITRDLSLAGVVKNLELFEHKNSLVLAQEDFGGQALKLLLQSQKLAVENFLAIAVPLAETLGHLHQRNIIHKDVNPANIIINPKTRQAKLTDFGLASLLPKENLAQWNRLEGTLAYISPEQTGRMNRSIDYRTDLYSLGVTFYEMLTGQLPFAVHDPLELVHSHIAKTPLSPSALDSQIPPALAEIIMKLLAKTAEERYQSGFGLQADLEKCREQWQRDGRIEIFTLGQADFSERFQIPEKLYGREEEIAALLAVFDRVMQGRREILLVTGHPGIGKSSLIHEVHKSLVRERGYFVAGKFDQYQRNVPFASLIQAFQDLVRQLLTENETQLQYWRERIQAALGVNGKVIAAVIPEIELIIGEQPPAPELSPAEAQNRFKLVFQNFMTALPAKEHPLVIFLDDLQWADSASLQLLQYLIITKASPYFFGIGAYRDNEVGPAHPLTLALEAIEKAGVELHRLSVRPLHLDHVSQLIADTLRCPPETAQPLAQLVLEKTAGNPFFVTQFLKSLHEEKLLAPEAAVAGWRWDLEQIRQRNITDNVVELMANKVQKLDAATQQSLKFAACIGGQFDLQTLAVVAEKPSEVIAMELAEALAEGLIILISDGSAALTTSFESDKHNDSAKSPSALSPPPSAIYKFAHDRVHQAVYSLIPEAGKNPLHRRIGQLLLRSTPESRLEQKIFDLANHLNLSAALIDSEAERITLAQLNLRAGHKAKLSTAYEPAFNYLQAGLDLLRADDWEKQYDLALRLHIEAAESAYLSGNIEAMEKLVEAVLQRAKSLLDQVKVYEVKLDAYIAQRQLQKVIEIGVPVLRKLGLYFPDKPNKLHVTFSFLAAKFALAGKAIASFSALPKMTDPLKLAAMRISARVGSAAYFLSPNLLALTAFKPLNLSLKYGNSAASAHVYAGQGIIFCGKLNDFETGYQFGRLGLQVAEILDAKETKARAIFIFNCLVRHWKDHMRDTLAPFLEAYQCALEVGDLEFAGLSIIHHLYFSYFCGIALGVLAGEREKYDHAVDPLNQETHRHVKNMTLQFLWNLMGRSEDPRCMRGEIYDEETGVAEHLRANDRYALFQIHFYKMILEYSFGACAHVLEEAALAEQYLGAVGAYAVTTINFYDSLARLALVPEAESAEQKKLLRKVRANQKRMKTWARHAPMNHLHKYELVEAERLRVLGDAPRAMAFYDCAIANAKKHQYLQEEALANELAAKFYLSRGQEKIAKTYMAEARYLYHKWGALAKVKWLEEKYRDLLRETATPSEATRLSSRATVSTSGTSSTSAAGALDFLSVLKASQTISGEIDLEKLLKKMIAIVIENGGAQKGYFLLERNGQWLIEAEGAADRQETVVLQSLPVAAKLSEAIVNYVSRTRETVVLGDAAKEGRFINDSYVRQHQAKAILCKPVIKQTDLIGILYLENDLSANVFVPDRLEALEILSAQIAVSLENARLYKELEQYNRTLEEKVAHRTAELQEKNEALTQTLQRLREMQNQLVTQEKLASLGQLTAGIAHEIKNPLNFVNNFAVLSVDLAKDLNDVLEANQDKKVAEIVAEISEILADLKLNAEKINHHGKRADGIVRSMMLHARGQSGEREAVDLNALLDEAVNLTFHGMRAQNTAFNLTIEKEYDESIGQIKVVQQNLSRVFLNLISNACYAVNEKMKAARDSFSPTLSVRTQNLGDKIEIRIRDNGNGIPLDIREKIFNPFFTTKPTGQGTGLGLSISYDIIVQEHRGEIAVETEEGRFTEFVVRLPRAEG
jgi:predicted ATPase/signal transduction histidine kinase